MSRTTRFRIVRGSICAPRGFRAAAVFCGIKGLGTGKGSDKGAKRDLALIVSDVPAAVAGMFTTNQVCAAPVKVSAKCASRQTARAIVVNSGNANACTGEQGMRDAKKMAETVAATYHRRPADESHGPAAHAILDCRYSRIQPNEVLVCSTGRIGVRMPMKKVEYGIRVCAPLLARSERAAGDAAEAIMTSDTRKKQVAVEIKIGGKTVRIGGICKGAGMIQPLMSVANVVATALRRRGGAPRRSGAATGHATMLAFITSDAAISSHLLKAALTEAVEQSFNRITVDGDMSTNDSVIALANGLAENRKIEKRDRDFRVFHAALTFVCLELAKMIVRDGEGVSRFVTVHVRNAKNARDAEIAARAVANSSLVRTSWCGGDPNWGRILCAVGYSGAAMDQARTDIGYAVSEGRAVTYGCRRGMPTNVPLKKLAAIVAAPEFDVHIDLHRGKSDFVLYASDLTEEYVTFNKGDVSNPESLEG